MRRVEISPGLNALVSIRPALRASDALYLGEEYDRDGGNPSRYAYEWGYKAGPGHATGLLPWITRISTTTTASNNRM